MEFQHATTSPPPPAPRFVAAHAVVRVARLDADGSAAGEIEEWLARPTAEEWDAIYGPRAATTPQPAACAFTGGLPGERVEVELRWSLPRPGRKRAKHPPAPQVRFVAVREPAPERVAPRCPVFGVCGGCQLQHLAYDQQLAWKTARVADALRTAGLGDVAVAPAIGCADPWHYRNHMRFSVDRQGRPGLTARNSHTVLPLDACPIAHPLINRALATLADRPNPRPQLLVRCGAATGQALIQPEPDAAAHEVLAAAGLDLRADALEELLNVPGGQDGTTRTATFRIRPSSFFQINTAQANRMAELVLAALPRGTDATLVDAYCGVGTFAALLAPHVGRVLAIEESASAVRDARWNVRDAPNVEVIQAKTEAIVPALGERVDGLVIDPPRAGCQRAVLDALCARRVPRVVYVSCEPSTLARDLAYLCGERGAYRVVSVRPLDMFPQTAHIETVVALEAA
jgi:23S rRNA (uracil1939-C5)-methyltransferase